MAYLVTYLPQNHLHGAKPRQATKATPAEALLFVKALEASAERITVQDAAGHRVERWELQALASE